MCWDCSRWKYVVWHIRWWHAWVCVQHLGGLGRLLVLLLVVLGFCRDSQVPG